MTAEIYNIWLATSTQARQAYRDRREQGEAYTGPMDDKTFRILNRIHDLDNVERLFKPATIGAKTYTLFSIYSEPGQSPAAIQSALDYLEEQWPAHFVVAGAWHWDGRQAGTQWEVVDGERTGNTTGAPAYPIPTVQLLKLMPDNYDEQTQTYSPATELSQVNLLAGQAPRRFS